MKRIWNPPKPGITLGSKPPVGKDAARPYYQAGDEIPEDVVVPPLFAKWVKIVPDATAPKAKK